MMDRLMLSRIDEELESAEVAALCFLCRDVVNRKRLEGIRDAKMLFLRLEEKGLLDNDLLSKLLHTIRRTDLLSLLETDSRPPEDVEILPQYRVMLYQIYEDMTKENLEKMKFLLSSNVGRRQIEACNTALDVFAELEKAGLLSNSRLGDLHAVLQELDQEMAETVENYMKRVTQPHQAMIPSRVSIDYQGVSSAPQPSQTTLSISETQSSIPYVYSDAEPNIHLPHQTLPPLEYYELTHIPRGVCVVINNEEFLGTELSKRGGTQQDEKALRAVFSLLGFTVMVHNNLIADAMRQELKKLSMRNYSHEDALVVCVLSHGQKGCVFGSDEQQVSLRELTQPFTSYNVPTLAGKPKLFFIQACQGSGYQRGALLHPQRTRQEEEGREGHLEEDAGPVHNETIPWDADFLLGMATVQEYKSFRNTSTGSIYIQELCKQLTMSAESPEMDDILTVLTRVNREVSKGVFRSYKQMPEPKYTLTKKLILKPA